MSHIDVSWPYFSTAFRGACRSWLVCWEPAQDSQLEGMCEQVAERACTSGAQGAERHRTSSSQFERGTDLIGLSCSPCKSQAGFIHEKEVPAPEVEQLIREDAVAAPAQWKCQRYTRKRGPSKRETVFQVGAEAQQIHEEQASGQVQSESSWHSASLAPSQLLSCHWRVDRFWEHWKGLVSSVNCQGVPGVAVGARVCSARSRCALSGSCPS